MKKQWKYRAGGKARGMIPLVFTFAASGAVSLEFYKGSLGNSGFFFPAAMAGLTFFLIVVCVFSQKFRKLLVDERGFYYRSMPGNGRYYLYREVEEAWLSSGKGLFGTEQYFCALRLLDGRILRFPYIPVEAEGVRYLLEEVRKLKLPADMEDLAAETREYIITGKAYGARGVRGPALTLIIFLLMTVPMFSEALSQNPVPMLFFSGIALSILGIGAVRQIIRYIYLQVRIGGRGFYFRSNPFNGREYSYEDILRCRVDMRVTRRSSSTRSSRNYMYFYYFSFTERSGKVTRFSFDKPVYGHEIEVLQSRIERAQGWRQKAARAK